VINRRQNKQNPNSNIETGKKSVTGTYSLDTENIKKNIQQNNLSNSYSENGSDITAAIEGTSDCPGEPCETSMPSIIVGAPETRGIFDMRSCCNNELIPPSCENMREKQQ